MNVQTQLKFDLEAYVAKLAMDARSASKTVAAAPTAQRNQALIEAAQSIEAAAATIARQNAIDLQAGEQSSLSAPLLDRLELTGSRIKRMAENLRQVAELEDPVGKITDLVSRPSGIRVGRMRVPLGVIGIIYESRPNVTVEAASLCLKSANAVILRGGSEAFFSNQAIVKCLHAGLQAAGLPVAAIQYIETTDRSAIDALITQDAAVDVIIPRGGKGLIERISAKSVIPVIKHLDGVCHVYVDAGADMAQAAPIVINSKTHRYGVCNAMETLLVHEAAALQIFSSAVPQLKSKGVELRGCERARAIDPTLSKVTEADWHAEYLAPILAVRIVDSIEQAIAHISQYGSQHTDCIVTSDVANADRFLREVDSSSVMVNASTRFADGFEYGLGAEIGISTNKLHARGPVGLDGLTMQKFVVFGQGHVRQ